MAELVPKADSSIQVTTGSCSPALASAAGSFSVPQTTSVPEPGTKLGFGVLVFAEKRLDGKLLWLELRAGKGNVLAGAVLQELVAHLRGHQDDPRLRCAVIAAAGNHFSFGASVEEHQPDQAAAMLATFHQAVRAIAGFPLPVVAAVQGKCLGGAFEVALACHVVLASPTAQFACPEIKLGVFPPVLAVLGPLRLGSALSDRLLLTGAELPAQAAGQCGFAEILSGEAFEAEVLGWVERHFAGLSGYCLRVATAAVRQTSALQTALGADLDAAERRYLQQLLPSHDGNEGIAAFLARRSPLWRDA